MRDTYCALYGFRTVCHAPTSHLINDIKYYGGKKKIASYHIIPRLNREEKILSVLVKIVCAFVTQTTVNQYITLYTSKNNGKKISA